MREGQAAAPAEIRHLVSSKLYNGMVWSIVAALLHNYKKGFYMSIMDLLNFPIPFAMG